MSEIKELLCESCIHKEVCSLKTDYRNVQEKIDHLNIATGENSYIPLRNIKWIEPVVLKCKHYKNKKTPTDYVREISQL